MFVNFGNAGQFSQATTLALNEEGGGQQLTSFIFGEEGGGGGQVTTLALNEEGGQATDRFSTQQVLNVAGQADADHNGVLSSAELDAHITQQQDMLQRIEDGEIVFFADPSQQIARMKSDLNAAKFMQKNFDAMAQVDKKEGLSAQDIRTTANRDFRPNELSQNDVDSLSQNNGQSQIHDWILQILQWFRNIFGGYGL